MELYKDEDYRAAKRGTILRFVGLAAILAATIAVMALFLTVWRNEILSMAACAVGASVLYFFLSMKALPYTLFRMTAPVSASQTKTILPEAAATRRPSPENMIGL